MTTLALQDVSTGVSGVAFCWSCPGPATSPPLRTAARKEAANPVSPRPETRARRPHAPAARPAPGRDPGPSSGLLGVQEQGPRGHT